MRISDWSSDVCSSDLLAVHQVLAVEDLLHALGKGVQHGGVVVQIARLHELDLRVAGGDDIGVVVDALHQDAGEEEIGRSEEHTSELQSLMRISSAVFCLNKKKTDIQILNKTTITKHHRIS